MVVYGALILSAFLEVAFGNVDIITNPSKRCVPTSTQTGACVRCVCTADGVYHCHTLHCLQEELMKKIIETKEKECEPGFTYRLDTIICSCSNTGHWRSQKCRENFRQILNIKNKYSITKTQVLIKGTNNICTPNHLYSIDCNICVCSESGYINLSSCTTRVCTYKYKDERCIIGDVLKTGKELCICSDINYFIDKRCIEMKNTTISEVKAEDLNNAINIGSYWDDLKVKCKPFYIYMIDCSRCTCSAGGVLHCVNKDCNAHSLSDADKANLRSMTWKRHNAMLMNLPMLKDLDAKCEPGVKYRYKCNSCICSKIGPVCTTMLCLEDIKLTVSDLRQMASPVLTNSYVASPDIMFRNLSKI